MHDHPTLRLIGILAALSFVLTSGLAVAVEPVDLLPQFAIAKLGTARLRHPRGVNSLQYSPDGKRLLSVGGDRKARVWELPSGRLVLELEAELAEFVSAEEILVSRKGPNLDVFNISTGKSARKLEGKGRAVNCLSAVTTDRKVVVSDQDNVITLWDVGTGEIWNTISPRDQLAVSSLALIDNGRQVAAGIGDKTVFWEWATQRELGRLEGHTAEITDIACKADYLATASHPGDELRVWRGREPLEHFHGGEHRPFSPTFSPDAKLMAWGSSRGELHVWDLTARREKWKVDIRLQPRGIAFSPDNSTIAVGTVGGVILLFDPATGKELAPTFGHRAEINGLVCLPGKSGIITSSSDGSVRQWMPGPDSGKLLDDPATRRYLLSIRCSQDGKHFVGGGADGKIHVWDLATGKKTNEWKSPDVYVREVAISPGGEEVVSVGDTGVVRFWDPIRGVEIHRLDTKGAASQVALVASGASFAVPQSDGVRILAKTTLKEVRHLSSGLIAASNGSNFLVVVENSIDRRRLTSTGKPRIHDLKDGSTVELEAIPDLQTFALSEDGLWFAGSLRNGSSVSLWDVRAGKKVREYVGHVGPVSAISFHPDGRCLASGGFDTTVMVWELPKAGD